MIVVADTLPKNAFLVGLLPRVKLGQNGIVPPSKEGKILGGWELCVHGISWVPHLQNLSSNSGDIIYTTNTG